MSNWLPELLDTGGPKLTFLCGRLHLRDFALRKRSHFVSVDSILRVSVTQWFNST
jgi:hypothetical protein